jgi:hypothetical protein
MYSVPMRGDCPPISSTTGVETIALQSLSE